MSFSPRVIALLGFGEAGSAIARGLCVEGGWRGPSKPGDNAPRRVIAIDTALDKDARGTALGETARALDVAIEDHYGAALSEADLVISAVQGEFARDAAAAAAPTTAVLSENGTRPRTGPERADRYRERPPAPAQNGQSHNHSLLQVALLRDS